MTFRRIKYRMKRNRGVWGLAFPDEYRIELDPSTEQKTLMDIAAHEALHVLFPEKTEVQIDNAGKTLADLLWRLGFRHKDEVE